MTKPLMLQIPTDVVRNSNYKLDDKSFTVYAFLLYKKFKSFGSSQIEIVISELKEITTITDTRTIKKCFKQLIENNLVTCNVNRLSEFKPITVTLHSDFDNAYFTQLPMEVIHRIDQIGTIGFRLLYYYESYINRTNTQSLFCFTSYQTIISDIHISNHSVTKYNKLLSDLKLLKITKHKSTFDSYSDGGLEKFNNHYELMIGKL